MSKLNHPSLTVNQSATGGPQSITSAITLPGTSSVTREPGGAGPSSGSNVAQSSSTYIGTSLAAWTSGPRTVCTVPFTSSSHNFPAPRTDTPVKSGNRAGFRHPPLRVVPRRRSTPGGISEPSSRTVGHSSRHSQQNFSGSAEDRSSLSEASGRYGSISSLGFGNANSRPSFRVPSFSGIHPDRSAARSPPPHPPSPGRKSVPEESNHSSASSSSWSCPASPRTMASP
mmetsp:Transcript_51383/g.117145  ORF Transcript_51383/g.117145 Transcript_51383/m.117145 type:complete len:228 (-) Transcript_51383:501-1184(-)